MRLAVLVVIFASNTTSILGQNGPCPTAATICSPEPTNHSDFVDRLIRYHDYGEYDREIREVANAARDYLRVVAVNAAKPEKLAVVFDIDETALSNWKAIAACGFCTYDVLEELCSSAHDSQYCHDDDPAITPVLELYNFAKALGLSVFFVTGRPERERNLTMKNLIAVGFSGWAGLLMQPNDNEVPARIYKPRDRMQISKEFRIVLNIGDQASDLAGCCAERVFKLPNPFYMLK
jgi:acid phosphatase